MSRFGNASARGFASSFPMQATDNGVPPMILYGAKRG